MSYKVSVVYLTKNGGDLLERSLSAVLAQDYDGEVEIIAVDSGSTDGTLELLTKLPVRLFTIPPQDFNFGLTRDYGFSLAEGEILIPISQDVVPIGTDWLQKLTKPFENNQVAIVQGVDIPNFDIDLFFWERINLFYYTRDVKKWMRSYNNIGVSFTACAIRRTIWDKLRLGRVEMSEDKVFQKKVVEGGYKIAQAVEALDHHSHMYNTETLAKRCQNEGLGWQGVGVQYTLWDMLLDIFNPIVLVALAYGIVTFKITRAAELLFPVIRPLYLYLGNSRTASYVK